MTNICCNQVLYFDIPVKGGRGKQHVCKLTFKMEYLFADCYDLTFPTIPVLCRLDAINPAEAAVLVVLPCFHSSPVRFDLLRLAFIEKRGGENYELILHRTSLVSSSRCPQCIFSRLHLSRGQ